MGQAATKQHHHGHDGSAASHHSSSSQSPSYPPSVDGGALVPQGVYTGPQDYSHDVVKTAIVKRKLMPFYKGVDDEDSYSGRTHVSECPICFLVSTAMKVQRLSNQALTDRFWPPSILLTTVLSIDAQSHKMLRTANLYRMFRADQESRSKSHKPAILTAGGMPLLYSRELWCGVHPAP